MRYRIEYPANPNYLIIHVDKRIIEGHVENFRSLDCCEAESSELARDIFGVDGVVSFSLKAYSIYILKAEVFDWEEIISPVIYYLNTYLDPEGKGEEVVASKQALLSLGSSDFLVSLR